jgi:hypothetical protein
MYYSKNPETDEFRETPMERERNQLIMQAHALGHFSIVETYNRLKEKFYWRNMMKDITKLHSLLQICSN